MADDAPISDLSPRNNTFLLGHEEAEQMFLNAWKNNSLHNSWLISGVEGVGKATLAYKLARFLLSADESAKAKYTSIDISPDSPICKLVSNNSHPDLKIIERDYTETDRKKVIKAIKDGDRLSDAELKDLKKSAFIRIDDVRTINEFLSKRSSGDGWRVVIIDSIDDMNGASANAVLKILEEPPHKTLMMLISHNPNRLLPTIKSRCAKLELKPLKETQVASLLRRYRPEMDEKSIKKITSIASGSIGKALNYVDNNAADRFDTLSNLLSTGASFKLSNLLDFCNEAASNEDNYYLTQELILKYLSEKVKQTTQVMEVAAAWDNAVKIFSETDRLNLDKKQALINIIAHVCKQL